MLQLTANTWDELVTNSSKNVLVVLVNEHRPDTILASGIVRRWLYTLADVLPQHPDLVLATFDTHLNDVRNKHLPTALPKPFSSQQPTRLSPSTRAPAQTAPRLCSRG